MRIYGGIKILDFFIGKNKRENNQSACSIKFYMENEVLSGVHKIAFKVRKDVERVIGVCPDETNDKNNMGVYQVIYGTIGHSKILDYLNNEKLIDLSIIKGKREVYIFNIIKSPFDGAKSALVIAGSDKRGTIYGLFHLSECIGVSPLVDWSDVRPSKKESIILSEADNVVSKEPSVKYRGIFINDEWPAFGTWATEHFGGLNAEMYEHVFELLLRLKGNYLWPAMWKSNFSMDGPGILNAELADEYGIVLGSSHHEPCMRNGEEYGLLRGKDSIYGDAWDYITNKDGILKFWEDGLKRNGKFENIITMGMRGERDTPILGKDKTLEDNINLLREILKNQNRLIKENINDKLNEVNRIFVLFTEVEAFFYGDKDTQGLIGDKELEGVTIMLSDDNFGNLRSLPDKKMRQHNGGYGLYYHLDFHGGAYAYDWMNTNYLPKMWEQLSMAYDYGIRDVWIANVGDISFLEYPLSYFFDMAYDMDKWGSNKPNNCDDYTKQWIDKQFNNEFSQDDKMIIHEILNGYTKINHNRKPEIMNSKVYHPVHYGETDNLIKSARKIIENAEMLRKKCTEKLMPAYYELIYFPACASANLSLMQLYAGKNEFYANEGRVEANDYADRIAECIKKDRILTEELHNIDNGKWYGMGLSEHVGFVNWNEEGCRYPFMIKIEPANKPRIIVAPSNSTEYTEGGEWTGKDLVISDFLNQNVNEVNIDIACGSRMPAYYSVSTDCKWINISKRQGCVAGKDVLSLSVDRNKIKGSEEGKVIITSGNNNVTIIVQAENYDVLSLNKMTFLEAQGYISIEAEHYSRKYDVNGIGFKKMKDYGRTLSAIKVLPPVEDFLENSDRPYVEYSFIAKNTGEYNVDFYLAPSNTTYIDRKLYFGLQINDEEIIIQNAVSDKFKSLDCTCVEWVSAVRDNIRIYSSSIRCKKGFNKMRIYSVSPSFVLEKIVIYAQEVRLPKSYLGPVESYYKK